MFQPTRPLRGATQQADHAGQAADVSTHAPLAGRDAPAWGLPSPMFRRFNPRAPCGARQGGVGRAETLLQVSTHAPLAGRDRTGAGEARTANVSTHAPLAGRDAEAFNNLLITNLFQPTRPLRGATYLYREQMDSGKLFQPTRPLRGATAMQGTTGRRLNVSTHAPLAGRDCKGEAASK